MEQVGFVRKVIDDKLELEVRRISGCGDNCKGCGSSCDIPAHVITLPNELNAKVGDFVELEGETTKILKYALIVYMIPFVFLVLGIALGGIYFKSKGIDSYEGLSFLSGIFFLGVSFIFVRSIDKNIAKKDERSIRATRIL